MRRIGGDSRRDWQYEKFRAYGFLKNLRFFDPFFVLFLRESGLSFLAIGSLISLREVAVNVLEIPTGVLADAFGRRRAMLAGFGAYIVSFVLFYLGSGYGAFVLAMLAFALGETFRSGTHKAMILEHLRLQGMLDRKVEYYGKTRAASQFGSAVASLLAAALVLWKGSYRIVFLASTVPYVLNFLLLASYPATLDGEHVRSFSPGWRQIGMRLRSSLGDLVQLLREPPVLQGLVNGAAFDAVFETTKDYIQPIVAAQAVALPLLLGWEVQRRTAILLGVVYFFIYLATSAACASAGAVHRRLDSPTTAINRTLVLGFGVIALGGLAAWLHVPAITIAALVSVFVLHNLRRPMIVGYLSDAMPHRAMASGLSVEVQLRTVLMAALAPVLGWLADRLGIGPALLMTAAGALILVPLLLVRGSRSAS